MMSKKSQVVVALNRHAGYEDVHPELVVEDAMRPGWAYEFLSDEGTAVVIALDRPEGYEHMSAATLATEAIKQAWPPWSVVKG